MPLHATTIRTLVKINGGEVQVAGTSTTTEVSLLGLLAYPAGASVEG